METKTKTPELKKLRAIDIVKGMKRAPIENALKLLDRTIYGELPDLQSFIIAFDNVETTIEQRAQLEQLKDDLVNLKGVTYNYQAKLETYLILRLQEILYVKNNTI